jgi:hypothetical protein
VILAGPERLVLHQPVLRAVAIRRDGQMRVYNQRIVPIRVATYDEWLAQEVAAVDAITTHDAAVTKSVFPFYYEFITD